MPGVSQFETQYRNLLDTVRFEDGKPVVDSISTIDSTQIKRVALKAGSELKRHTAPTPVLIVWLRGKAIFDVDGETFVMHPGSTLQMAPETPHSVTAETDCVFIVMKFLAE